MLNLKELSERALKDMYCTKDYTPFRTLGFDPEELLQLKEMNSKQLKGLMIFCGIHVYDGVPLVVMYDNEMRDAYLEWRRVRIQEKKDELKQKLKRGIKWASYIQEAVQIMVNR